MKVVITITFCCNYLWNSKFMALDKSGKLSDFFSPTFWHACFLPPWQLAVWAGVGFLGGGGKPPTQLVGACSGVLFKVPSPRVLIHVGFFKWALPKSCYAKLCVTGW